MSKLKAIKKYALFFLTLLLLYFIVLTLFVDGPKVHPYIRDDDQEKTEIIHVASHGWHAGLVIDAKKVYQKLPQLKERFGDVPKIEIGWGDKGFYQANGITLSIAIRAIFIPSESVIHAVSVPMQSVQDYFPSSDVTKVCLNPKQLDSLLNFIANSFDYDEHGQIIAQRKGLYGDSQFYNGEGSYFLMNTCNKWVAKGLKSAGLDISPTFKLTSQSVMNAIEAYACE